MRTLQTSYAPARSRRSGLQTVRALPTDVNRALICEPGDTAYGVHPRVNRSNVETLRPSFGVVSICLPSPAPFFLQDPPGTELAIIAQADAAQLVPNPGFSLKKVTGLKDTFELDSKSPAYLRPRLRLLSSQPLLRAVPARPSSSSSGADERGSARTLSLLPLLRLIALLLRRRRRQPELSKWSGSGGSALLNWSWVTLIDLLQALEEPLPVSAKSGNDVALIARNGEIATASTGPQLS
ncbi:hypothetical protein EDB87DRAFT_1686464 [Lactarius vividus]|nr:hypothetical protein EDB87DRAFT_1686464 [Lactarius vividus]